MISTTFIAEQRPKLERAFQDFRILAPDVTDQKPGPSRWSIKQVVGHLVDSASNNHHRFIRLQSNQTLDFPTYDQNEWVTANDYHNSDFEPLLTLWYQYNLHLLHVISAIPEACYSNIWARPDGKKVTLEFLITDYYAHLWHHITKICERLGTPATAYNFRY